MNDSINIPYPKPPIVEAVFDIRVEPAPDTNLEKLKSVIKKVRYGEPQALFNVVGQFQVGAQTGASTTQTQIGFQGRNTDKRRVIHVRRDGMLYSQLAPYNQWTDFIKESRRLWSAYRSVQPHGSVTRVAVRFVNRIVIPLPEIKLADYFKTFPKVSDDLQHSLLTFVCNVCLQLSEPGYKAIINFLEMEPDQILTKAFLLDIDVFCDEALPQDEDGLWLAINKLRSLKNTAFKYSVTTQTEALFQ